MTPTEQAARWLADVERYTPPYTNGNWLLETETLAAIARHLAPGDDPVAWRWHWNGGDEPGVWAYSETPKVSDDQITAEPLYSVARIAALTATVGGLQQAMTDADNDVILAHQAREAAEAEAATLRDRLARMEGALPIPARLVPELITWAKDEQQHWPDDTAYQHDLAAFLAALTDGGSNG